MITNLMTKLATLREEMEKAKVDVVAAFYTSQLCFDECGIYYGDRFDDCLKQRMAIYFDLDLSQVAIDETVWLTLGGIDAVSDETNDSVHTIEEQVKDLDAEVVIQPTSEGPTASVIPFAANGLSTMDSSVFDVPLS